MIDRSDIWLCQVVGDQMNGTILAWSPPGRGYERKYTMPLNLMSTHTKSRLFMGTLLMAANGDRLEALGGLYY